MKRPSTVVGLRYHKRLTATLYCIIATLAAACGYILSMAE